MAVFGEAGSWGGVAAQRVVVGLVAGVALWAVTGASAAPAAVEPIAAEARGAEVGSCARPLADVVWGFLLVLLALTVPVWGYIKHISHDVPFRLLVLLIGVLAPLQHLGEVIQNSWRCVAMVWKCHKLEDPEMRLMSFKWVRILHLVLNPWSQLPARILTCCDIVLYLPNGASHESNEMSSGELEGLEKAKEVIGRDLESRLKSNEVSCRRSELLDEPWAWLWDSEEYVVDESEAMVVGEDRSRKCTNEYYHKKQLGIDGKHALLFGTYSKDEKYNLLPNYGKLKFLRGNSGFATIAIAIQAIGYIYAVMFRSIKGLRVAPVEVIGLILNMILLVKVSNYSTSNPCNRPLVIYMNEEEEEKFLGVLKSTSKSYFDLNVRIPDLMSFSTFLIFLLCVLIPLVYYIVILKRDTNIMIVLPLILFSLGLFGDFVGQSCDILNKSDDLIRPLVLLSILLNGIAYSWAMVVTLQYWKPQHFNTRPELVDLSQIIPFIG